MKGKAKATVTTQVKVTRADGSVEHRTVKQPVTQRVADKLKEIWKNG